jgi:hypothetical protein
MSEQPDDPVLSMLREIRSDIKAINTRMDQTNATAMKMWKQFIGHRSMVERTVTDVDVEIAQLKRRVSQLEATQEKTR